MKRRHPGGRTCLGALLLMPLTLPALAVRVAYRRITNRPTTTTGGQQ